MLIQQEGYYRGVIVSGGVGESSGGYPQAVLSLRADEMHVEGDEYGPADPAANETMYYGVLFDSKDRETLNCKQIKKITDWDGAAFFDTPTCLDTLLDAGEIPVQFRMEWREYDGQTNLQCTWIDPIGASPVRGVMKLDAGAAKTLQGRYAAILAKTKTAKPASAPAKASKPAGKKKDKSAAPKAAAPTADPNSPELPWNKPAAPAQPKPTPPKPASPKPQAGGTCTADEAWEAVIAARRDGLSDDDLCAIWLNEVKEQAPNGMESMMQPADWFRLRESVVEKVK